MHRVRAGELTMWRVRVYYPGDTIGHAFGEVVSNDAVNTVTEMLDDMSERGVIRDWRWEDAE